MCNTYSKCKCCQHLFLRVTTTSLRRVCTVTSLRCLPASLSSLILSTHTLRAFDWHPIHKFEPNKITLVRINCNELHGYLTCINLFLSCTLIICMPIVPFECLFVFIYRSFDCSLLKYWGAVMFVLVLHFLSILRQYYCFTCSK